MAAEPIPFPQAESAPTQVDAAPPTPQQAAKAALGQAAQGKAERMVGRAVGRQLDQITGGLHRKGAIEKRAARFIDRVISNLVFTLIFGAIFVFLFGAAFLFIVGAVVWALL